MWKEIAREEWPSFLQGFRDQHRAWLVSISPGNGEPSRFRPLRDVRYVTDGGNRIVVAVGSGPSPTEIAVGDPRTVAVDETLEGAHRGLVVEGPDGNLLLRFLSPMRPERVDGLPPGGW